MNTKNTGFYITGEKGFHITFENGWTVSVQFGPGNYCNNYNARIGRDEKLCGERGSTDAECAVWGPGGDMLSYEKWGGDTVGGRMSPADVLELLNWASRQARVEE